MQYKTFSGTSWANMANGVRAHTRAIQALQTSLPSAIADVEVTRNEITFTKFNGESISATVSGGQMESSPIVISSVQPTNGAAIWIDAGTSVNAVIANNSIVSNGAPADGTSMWIEVDGEAAASIASAVSASGSVVLDSASTVPFSVGIDDTGIYIVTPDEEEIVSSGTSVEA